MGRLPKFEKRMKYLFAILMSFLAICACKKNSQTVHAAPYQNLAVITGINPCAYACVDTCPCACGNFLFHFTDSSFAGNIVVDNPTIINLPLNTKFPVYIKVNWVNTTRCDIAAIRITAYLMY
jgi:hypothetical protein